MEALIRSGVVAFRVVGDVLLVKDIWKTAVEFNFTDDAMEILTTSAVGQIDDVVRVGLISQLDDYERLVRESIDDVVGSGRNIIDDFDSIVEDIININKRYSDGRDVNNSISSIVNSASYYKDPYEQVGAIGRGIAQHAFENGNKRTAFDTMKMLISDMNLKSPLSDNQFWDLIYDMSSSDGLSDVAEIARRLQGK